MSFIDGLHISGSAMSVQRTRVNLATSNLANAETTRGPDGEVYRRRDPSLESVSFENSFGEPESDGAIMGVQIKEIVEDQTPGRRVHNPSHPDADEQGYVTYPNIDPIHEVVNLMSASNSYEANATAMETLKGMALRALELLR